MLLIRYGLIRQRSILGRLLMRIPRRWFYITNARLGHDTTTYITIHLKRRQR